MNLNQKNIKIFHFFNLVHALWFISNAYKQRFSQLVEFWKKISNMTSSFWSLNPNQYDVWEAFQVWGGLLEPPYLSQPFMVRISKFFCLVKACENPHWFLFHKWLPIVHRLAARRRRSGEGRSRQYFQVKNSKFSIFSYKYVIYLKWKLKLCRNQIHDKIIWFLSEKLEKSPFFSFLPQKRGWPGVFDG